MRNGLLLPFLLCLIYQALRMTPVRKAYTEYSVRLCVRKCKSKAVVNVWYSVGTKPILERYHNTLLLKTIPYPILSAL